MKKYLTINYNFLLHIKLILKNKLLKLILNLKDYLQVLRVHKISLNYMI